VFPEGAVIWVAERPEIQVQVRRADLPVDLLGGPLVVRPLAQDDPEANPDQVDRADRAVISKFAVLKISPGWNAYPDFPDSARKNEFV
jgi:hypothetical protein